MSTLGAKNERFGISTLFRLYHHGMREVKQRLDGKAPAPIARAVLSPQSIEAIRATHGCLAHAHDAAPDEPDGAAHDRHLRRPVPRAARHRGRRDDHLRRDRRRRRRQRQRDRARHRRRARGHRRRPRRRDPGLFGYNYLNSRIKEIVADMRVFVDEFVTRIAETILVRRPCPQPAGDDDVYDEINVTPMLDLAYVLLVIFIILTTATVQGIKVNLPKASAQPASPRARPRPSRSPPTARSTWTRSR